MNFEVWLYEVVNGGHDWPGSNGNMDIESSYEIWKFFKQYIYSLGDINQDNILNVLDIISLIDLILSQDTNDYPLADLNGDGEVNVIDVVSLVNIILSN